MQPTGIQWLATYGKRCKRASPWHAQVFGDLGMGIGHQNAVGAASSALIQTWKIHLIPVLTGHEP